MNRTLLASVAAVVLVLVSVLVSWNTGTSPWPVWVGGSVAALAYVFGAWCAPLFGAGVSLGGTVFTRWRRAWDTPKSVQILSGAVVTVVLTLMGVFPGASAVGFGIAAALGVGALLPVPQDGADSEDARSA